MLNRNLYNNYFAKNLEHRETPKLHQIIGRYSDYTQIKLNNILAKYCKDISIKLIFTTFKIESMFSLNYHVPKSMKSYVIYKFYSASCDACYISEPIRHFSTRITKYLCTDKALYVYKHLQISQQCKDQFQNSCSDILD